MSALRARIGGLGLFGLSVILNGVVSLVAIPAVTAFVGADAWASMATGQSIGQSMAVLVIFGWGLTGPILIATAKSEDRPGLFLDSLLARSVLLIPLLLVQAAVTIAIVPHGKVTAFVAGAAMTLAGVAANWYFTGEQKPTRFLLLDTVPRVAGTLGGVALVALTHDLLLFALAQLAGSIVALALSCVVIFRRARLDVRAAFRWRRIRQSLADQRHGVVATGLYAAYMPAVLGIVAVACPSVLPMFVLADRVAKFVAMAVSPLTQVFQGWVPRADGFELHRRLRLSGLVTLAFALVGGTAYSLLLPTFSTVLTHGEVRFDLVSAVAFGVVAATTIMSPWVTNVGLVTVGRVRLVAASTAVGVPATLVALVIAELFAGPEWAAVALATGNLAILLWQVSALRRTTRPLRHDEDRDDDRDAIRLAGVASP